MIKKAMILAAGFGKRIHPLTCKLPKPLLKIGNTTLLSNALKFLELFGISEVVINVHYLGEQIVDYINKNNFWIITNNYKEYKKIVKKNSCIKKYNSFPEKLISINQNWQHQRFNWYIVFCKR